MLPPMRNGGSSTNRSLRSPKLRQEHPRSDARGPNPGAGNPALPSRLGYCAAEFQLAAANTPGIAFFRRSIQAGVQAEASQPLRPWCKKQERSSAAETIQTIDVDLAVDRGIFKYGFDFGSKKKIARGAIEV